MKLKLYLCITASAFMLSLVPISGNAMTTRSDLPETTQDGPVPDRAMPTEAGSLDHEKKGSVSVADPYSVAPANTAKRGPEITIDAAENDPYRVTAEDQANPDGDVTGNGAVKETMPVPEIAPARSSAVSKWLEARATKGVDGVTAIKTSRFRTERWNLAVAGATIAVAGCTIATIPMERRNRR